MLYNFRVEFGTDVECEPTSIVPTFQTSTRGAGSVVVSTSDWHAGGPGLIHRRNEPVIFGITNTRQRTDIVVVCDWRCNAMRHAHWHTSYINVH